VIRSDGCRSQDQLDHLRRFFRTNSSGGWFLTASAAGTLLSAWQYSHLNAVHKFGSQARVPHFAQTTWRESRGGPDMLEGYDHIVSECKGHVVAPRRRFVQTARCSRHVRILVLRVVLCRPLAPRTPRTRTQPAGSSD